MTTFQEKMADISKAINEGNIRDVQQLMDRMELAKVTDSTGFSPLHLAVQAGDTKITRWMVKNFPEAANVKDKVILKKRFCEKMDKKRRQYKNDALIHLLMRRRMVMTNKSHNNLQLLSDELEFTSQIGNSLIIN